MYNESTCLNIWLCPVCGIYMENGISLILYLLNHLLCHTMPQLFWFGLQTLLVHFFMLDVITVCFVWCTYVCIQILIYYFFIVQIQIQIVWILGSLSSGYVKSCPLGYIAVWSIVSQPLFWKQSPLSSGGKWCFLHGDVHPERQLTYSGLHRIMS